MYIYIYVCMYKSFVWAITCICLGAHYSPKKNDQQQQEEEEDTRDCILDTGIGICHLWCLLDQ